MVIWCTRTKHWPVIPQQLVGSIRSTNQLRGVVIGGLNTGYSLKNDPFTGYSLPKMSFPAYGIILPITVYKDDKFAFPR